MIGVPVPAGGGGVSAFLRVELPGRRLPGGFGVLDGVHPDRWPGHRDPGHPRPGAQNIGIVGAFGVGAYIALAGLWGSPILGTSMNPARTFGPDLVGAVFAITGCDPTSPRQRMTPADGRMTLRRLTSLRRHDLPCVQGPAAAAQSRTLTPAATSIRAERADRRLRDSSNTGGVLDWPGVIATGHSPAGGSFDSKAFLQIPPTAS